MKKYRVFDFETNTEKVYTDKDFKIYANFMRRNDASPELANKVLTVINALDAVAKVLDDISFNDVEPDGRMAGLFAAQSLQIQQQIEILESFIQ